MLWSLPCPSLLNGLRQLSFSTLPPGNQAWVPPDFDLGGQIQVPCTEACHSSIFLRFSLSPSNPPDLPLLSALQ